MAASEQERLRRGRGDGGAVLVEFAILAPLLFLVVFGIIEFGNAFYQQLDVRHGAREGMRLAAVNSDPANGETLQEERLALETCTRMDTDGGSAILVTIVKNGSSIGDSVTVTIEKKLDQLTGFLDFALGDKTITSTVQTRLEQTATYGDITDYECS